MNLSPRRREEASKKALVAIKRRQKNEEITEKDKSPDELPWPLDNREPPDGMDELKHFVEGLSNLSPQALCDQVVAWHLATRRREDDLCVLAARLS